MATSRKKLPPATPEDFDGMTLMRMVTRNIKRVHYIDVTLRDILTLIGGDNEQGKTSFLDSFGFCMGGKVAIQMQPIRNGQQEGFVQCDFGDGKDVRLTVKRTLMRLGQSDFTSDVDLEIPGHIPPTSIETFLKKLTGTYAFDPMEFDELTDEARFERVQQLVSNFDFKAYAKNRKTIFDKRTDVNRDMKREQGAADAIMVKAQPPCELVDESALTFELQEAGRKNADRATRESNRARGMEKIAELRAAADGVTERIAAAEKERDDQLARYLTQGNLRIAAIQEQIKLLERQIRDIHAGGDLARTERDNGVEEDRRRLNAEAAEQCAQADAIEQKIKEAGELPDEIDTAAISAKLAQARETNAQHAAWKQLRDNKAEHQTLASEHATESDELTKKIDALDAEKLKAIDAAKLPVSGIGFGDGYITLEATDKSGTTPWSQASEALRIDTSLALAMAMQPKLKVILIRNGSNIGKRIRQRIQERAAEKGYRVIMEVVEEGEGTHVVIENGEVKSRHETAEAATG